MFGAPIRQHTPTMTDTTDTTDSTDLESDVRELATIVESLALRVEELERQVEDGHPDLVDIREVQERLDLNRRTPARK